MKARKGISHKRKGYWAKNEKAIPFTRLRAWVVRVGR